MSYASQICPIVPTAQWKNQKVVVTVTINASSPSSTTSGAPDAETVLNGRFPTKVGRILFSGKRNHQKVTNGRCLFYCLAQLHTICLQFTRPIVGVNIKQTQPQCVHAHSLYLNTKNRSIQTITPGSMPHIAQTLFYFVCVQTLQIAVRTENRLIKATQQQ